jgi:hypothetical protein
VCVNPRIFVNHNEHHGGRTILEVKTKSLRVPSRELDKFRSSERN